MKKCKGCLEIKPIDDFYVLKGNSDGRTGKCKQCIKSRVKSNRDENSEHYKRYDRDRAMSPHRVSARALYILTEKGKSSVLKSNKKYRENNKAKYKAHCVVNNAIRDGKLKSMPCEECGETKTHGHHDDYAYPLNLRWLCPKHHKEWHKENGEGRNSE